MNLRKTLFALALFISPAVAFAHAGHDHSGLMAGQRAGRCHWPLSPACCSVACSVLTACRYH
jgi:hydrogenase/urease accessory protein HupE